MPDKRDATQAATNADADERQTLDPSVITPEMCRAAHDALISSRAAVDPKLCRKGGACAATLLVLPMRPFSWRMP